MKRTCPLCGVKSDDGKSKRSNQQNRYMWGVVYKVLSDHTGYTSDEIHEICKWKFLKTWVRLEKKNHQSEEMQITKSTASLSTVEIEKYLEEIRRWASIELGCWIPLPNESAYPEYQLPE